MLNLRNLSRNLLYEIASYYPKIRQTILCLDKIAKKKVEELDYFKSLIEDMGVMYARRMTHDELILHLSDGKLNLE